MKYYVLLLLSVCNLVAAQTVNEVFAKLNSQFTSHKTLQFETQYSLFRDASTKTVHQSYKGLFIKSSTNDVYMKIIDTEFINSRNGSLKINHNEKAMQVSDAVRFSGGDFDVSKLLNFCKIQSFKDYKAYWEIVLITKEFSGLDYSKIVLLVNKDYTLKKQVFFYNSGFDFSKDFGKQEVSNPRLEVEFKNYNQNYVNPSLFDTAAFYQVTKANKLLAAGKYKSYELIDKRSNALSNNKRTN